MDQPFRQQEYPVKQEHSQIYTLKSINSRDQMIDVIPVYNNDETYFEFNSGHWSAKEHIKYIMFLDYFSNLFVLKHNKKLWKIFTIMSNFIKTRNSSQCRSHHQKTQRKYSTIEQVLDKQRKKYLNYNIQFQKMKKVLCKLPIDNPIQIQKQKQTTHILPSIKILQQNIDYKLNRNSLSMINIDISQKPIDKSKPFISQKRLSYPHQKYIGSQCSIQMEDQDAQHSRYKQINLLINNSQIKQKNPDNLSYFNWNYSLPLTDENKQKKDQLGDTAASYTFDKKDEDNKNYEQKDTKNKQKPNFDQKEQQIGQQIKFFGNIVRMKKARSSLPSFDVFSTTGDSQFQNKFFNLKSFKKQISQNEQNKCKTYPAHSQRDDSSQDSYMSQKIFSNHQEPIVKSLFSGFISSLSSGAKSFQKNNNILGQDQYTSFNNLCNDNYKDEQNDQQLYFQGRKDKKVKKQQSIYRINRRQNLFYCQDRKKGNLCNQISGQSSDLCDQESIQFVNQIKFVQQNKPLKPKIDSISQKNNQDSNEPQFFVRNFSKKKSSQCSDPNKRQKKVEFAIQSPIYQLNPGIQNHHTLSNPQHNSQHNINSNNSQLINQTNSQGFRPYSNQNEEQQEQFGQGEPQLNILNSNGSINYYQNGYNYAQFMYYIPYQYPYFYNQFRNFLQFYIFYTIWKIYLQNQQNSNNR